MQAALCKEMRVKNKYGNRKKWAQGVNKRKKRNSVIYSTNILPTICQTPHPSIRKGLCMEDVVVSSQQSPGSVDCLGLWLIPSLDFPLGKVGVSPKMASLPWDSHIQWLVKGEITKDGLHCLESRQLWIAHSSASTLPGPVLLNLFQVEPPKSFPNRHTIANLFQVCFQWTWHETGVQLKQ